MPKAGWGKFRKPLININDEIRIFENKRHHRKRKFPRFTQDDLFKVYTKYKGNCVFCGLLTTTNYTYRYTGAHFIFEVPLERGGDVSIDNLLLTCAVHKHQYQPQKRLRERIPDVDSFPDLMEALFRAVKNEESWDKIRRIKHEMNTILEELAIHSRYMVYNEDRPIRIRTARKDKSIPDLVESFAKGEDTKQDVSDALKTIHVTRKYEVQK